MAWAAVSTGPPPMLWPSMPIFALSTNGWLARYFNAAGPPKPFWARTPPEKPWPVMSMASTT